MPDRTPAPERPCEMCATRVDEVSHEATTVERPADLMRYLQRSLARERVSLEDETVIEAELLNLLAVRRLFVSWMQAQEEGDGGSPGIDPGQFLRAWNDSVTRVIQLLRARRDLAGEAGGEWAALMDAVYDQLEEEG